MRNILSRFLAVGLALPLVSTPVLAHHGTSRYDLRKTITLNGTITGFDWINPHCLVYMDVKAENGMVQHWTIELASPFAMSHAGWSKKSLMVGDSVVAETHPAKNGITLGISSISKSVMKFVVNGKPVSAT
jgi:hypothetical protein